MVATVGLTLALPSCPEWAALRGGSRIVHLLCIPLSLLLDAVLLARFGRSPSKALLGLRSRGLSDWRDLFHAFDCIGVQSKACLN